MNVRHPMGALHSLSIKKIFYDKTDLKVVPATFSLVCVLSLKESTWKARTNVFYFTAKALFVLGKIKI